MKFGFLSEADPRPGQTYAQRYRDLTDEVVLADRMGFDVFGTSEQHFALGVASVSAPESLYPYLIAKTSRIRFRHASTLLLRNVNHPLRVAERVATMDILSGGRMELCTARGNTTLALRGFEVNIDTTREEWAEGIDLIKTAFTDDPFEFEGKYYRVPPRSLVPKPIQQSPYPPLSVASTGPDSVRAAAQKGIGILTSALERGWDQIAETIRSYREEAEKMKARGEFVNDVIAVNSTAYCATSTAKAVEEAGQTIVAERKMANDAYKRLSQISPDYAYMKDITDLASQMESVDYLVKESGSVVIGDPDTFIEFVQKYADLGADEVWFRLDTLPHALIMESIELIGRYVLPHFQTPGQMVRPAEENRERLRSRRAELKAQGSKLVDIPGVEQR